MTVAYGFHWCIERRFGYFSESLNPCVPVQEAEVMIRVIATIERFFIEAANKDEIRG